MEQTVKVDDASAARVAADTGTPPRSATARVPRAPRLPGRLAFWWRLLRARRHARRIVRARVGSRVRRVGGKLEVTLRVTRAGVTQSRFDRAAREAFDILRGEG